jgi:RimJ/RimL family protein N-acetyltransferase
LNIPHPYENGMAEAWIAQNCEQFQRGEAAHFAIVLRAQNELIGAVGLTFSEPHLRAELGYWIGRQYWSMGYGTEAARAMLDYAFVTRGLNRIEATHLCRNPSSGRVMQKLGMKHEGCSRQYFRKAGGFEDIERYALLRDEYFAGR